MPILSSLPNDAVADRVRATVPAPARLPAVDLLRGLAVIGMILVAYAGDWNHRFTVLTHADWRGSALADMIFPAFLFCVGVVMPFSLSRRARVQSTPTLLAGVLRRAALLFGLGLFLNLLPYFAFDSVRVMGIFQRIGLCYAAAAIVWLACARRGQHGPSVAALIAASAALALGYGALLLAWDAPGCGRACFDPVHSLPAAIDRAVLSVQHMWPYGTTNGVVTYEPEGLLSTFGALINVLVGMAVGCTLQRPRAPWALLAATGAALLAAGFLLDPLVPVVKKIWTPSFALLSSGFSILCLCALARLGGEGRWRAAIDVFGMNATLAFVLVSLLDVLLQYPFGGLAHANLHDSIAGLLGSVIPAPRVASATYSALLLALVGLLLWPLYRKGIHVRL